MRRQYANREEWERLLARRFEVERIDRPGFHGYLSRLSIEAVTAPFVVPLDGVSYRLADRSYSWLQQPFSQHRPLSVMGSASDWLISALDGYRARTYATCIARGRKS